MLPAETRESIKDTQAHGVFVVALVKTSDDIYVFSKRKDNLLNRNTRYACFGGVLQPTECSMSSFEDIYNHMKQELIEEIGLHAIDITVGTYIGMIDSREHNIGIVFAIDLSISAQTV